MNLYGRGIVLALCSKNNEADVWEVFDRHPDMVLQRRHLAAAQINWEDKATNLRRIAAELNLGLDSLVFVDDSDFEANLIRQLLPEVEVLRVPSDTGVEHRSLLASCGWFDTLTLSAEDRERGAAYRRKQSGNGSGWAATTSRPITGRSRWCRRSGWPIPSRSRASRS